MLCVVIGATAPLASSLFLLGEQPQKCMLWVPSLSALVSFTRTSKHNQVARLPEASDQELQHLGEGRKGGGRLDGRQRREMRTNAAPLSHVEGFKKKIDWVVEQGFEMKRRRMN